MPRGPRNAFRRGPLAVAIRFVLSFLFFSLLLLAWPAREAHACGAAYPGGPVMCDFPRADGSAGAPTRPILRLSASYAFTSTTLLFSPSDAGVLDRRADLTRHAAFVAAEIPLSRSPTSSIALQVGFGGIGGGELQTNATAVNAARTYEIGPGFSGFAGIAGRVLDGQGWLPFVHLTGTLSASHASTRGPSTLGSGPLGMPASSDRYTALDLRLGAIAGKSFSDARGNGVTPYIAARVFGGPIFWTIDGKDFTGTDLYKYQLGGGLSVALLDRRLDLFVEGVGLGERAVAAGIGTTFF